jgi:hypothetical protein
MIEEEMFSDHLKTCEYCRNEYYRLSKPTILVKGTSSYRKQKRLSELGAIIRGTSYPSLSIPMFRTKGASEVLRRPGPIEKEVKLKELGKLVRG